MLAIASECDCGMVITGHDHPEPGILFDCGGWYEQDLLNLANAVERDFAINVGHFYRHIISVMKAKADESGSSEYQRGVQDFIDQLEDVCRLAKEADKEKR